MTQAQDDLTRLRAAARALVEALPECDVPQCTHVATLMSDNDVDYDRNYCDVHAGPRGDHMLPYTAELRDLLALLGGE